MDDDFQHIGIKNRKKKYVNKKRNESNIFDNFNEEEYWNVLFRQNDFHFISPVKSCSLSQTDNILDFCKDKGNHFSIFYVWTSSLNYRINV